MTNRNEQPHRETARYCSHVQAPGNCTAHHDENCGAEGRVLRRSTLDARRSTQTALALLLWSCAWASLQAAPATDPFCVVLTREGKVEFARKGTTQWAAAETNQVLNVGDRFRTALRSRATLRWSDLSVVRVDQLTSMEIQPPEKPIDKPQLELRSGATYFFSRERPEEVQFRTPVAAGAIRGTEFNLAVDENGKTTVSLIDGEIQIANAQGQETLRSGEQATVEPGKAPAKTALVNAINVIQWALYYPAVVDLDDLGLSTPEKNALAEPIQAYQSGDLLKALGAYPENRQPATAPERAFRAALLLAVGRVEEAESDLKSVPADSLVANALREVIATVRNETLASLPTSKTGSEWMARSYYLQSKGQLTEALNAAREATSRSPNFGAAWIRAGELEFGFGRTAAALEAVDKGLRISPRNAQGLALRGFLLAARNRNRESLESFNQAIEIDGALGNAWLGRGLVKIRRGDGVGGREDLQVAATLEPQRAVLRSYLGKAWQHAGDPARARKELDLAKRLDPNDPTSWLYSALLHQEQNQINEAVKDLEQSKDLNDNRSLFRSRLLLDQDQAVRSANLATIYRDAGMFEYSAQEAARAVNYDYGNYSAHLFLANSYDALRDPKLINLRYETPWFAELLVANLLAPAGAGLLSSSISEQEYSRFFDAPHFGLFSSTEYYSSGDWVQFGSHYGYIDSTDYAIDAFYRTENGQRPNNDLEQLNLSGRVKQQITQKDSVFFDISYFDMESGDVSQYYNQNSASHTLRVTEKQEPNLLVGYHREWAPGSHTLFLGGRFDDTLTLEDTAPAILYLETSPFLPTTNRLRNAPDIAGLDYESELVAYSAEAQQIWQSPKFTFIGGGRYQTAEPEATSTIDRQNPLDPSPVRISSQDVETSLDRYSAYVYGHWQILDNLRLIAGVSYDRLEFPANIDTSPIIDEEDSEDQVSPKAGLVYSPFKDTHLRAYYAQSLGGVFFDNSIRLEPVQIAGFSQAYRSLIPESVIGLVPGTSFETMGVGLDQAIRKTGTYFVIEGQYLTSEADRTVGVLTNSDTAFPSPDSPSSTRQDLDYMEKSFIFAVNQLIAEEWSLGARYRLTHSDLHVKYPSLPAGTTGLADDLEHVSAILHQVNLYGAFHHRCGFFSQVNAVWTQQSNRKYTTDIPGDDIWQFHAFIGYRMFQRRLEAKLGLLNITDQDYQLNPLTLYNELPRERTLFAGLKWYF
ncbi:MAG: TonB-dependent receptor [Verrucomicrobia subdivision 3 bacterium]|nr:TonB-dependent receptor [Limisphaerales bacterium]